MRIPGWKTQPPDVKYGRMATCLILMASASDAVGVAAGVLSNDDKKKKRKHKHRDQVHHHGYDRNKHKRRKKDKRRR
jgi:hypothetical protein